MATISSYRDLDVWQVGMQLAVDCYLLTRAFPKEEVFGMTGQIRRSACAIPANIAEGNGRGRGRDYVRFLRIAQGSLKELETHLLLAARVGLTKQDTVEPLLQTCERIGKMLRALIVSLERQTDSRLPTPDSR